MNECVGLTGTQPQTLSARRRLCAHSRKAVAVALDSAFGDLPVCILGVAELESPHLVRIPAQWQKTLDGSPTSRSGSQLSTCIADGLP